MEPVFVPEAAVGAIGIYQENTADSEVETLGNESENDFDFHYDTVDDSENSINVNRSQNKSTKPRNTYSWKKDSENIPRDTSFLGHGFTANYIEVQSPYH